MNVSEVLQLNAAKRVTKLILPSALPVIFAGLRVGLGVGWMVLIAAEALAQSSGLGLFMWNLYQNGDANSMVSVMVTVLTIGVIGSANIDTNSRLCMASSIAGHRKAFGTDTVPGTYTDLELADVVILVGSNLAWCHPVLYQRVAAAKEARAGMKVVLVDPRRTRTDALADVHLRLRPDGDGALFAGLLSDLQRRG